MLDKLTFETFADHLNETFQLQLDGAESPLMFTLAEVNKLGSEPGEEDDFRQAFSLIFTGPADPILEQQIFELHHPEFNTLSLFLVPLGPKKGQMQYEAVFT